MSWVFISDSQGGRRRHYGWNGKPFPKLDLETYGVCESHFYDDDTITFDSRSIDCSVQRAPDEWWNRCSVPEELIEDLIALLKKSPL